MTRVSLSRENVLQDRQGRTFADVVNDAGQPFHQVLAFFDSEDRQRRMDESELHHNRPPMAGVVRELESQPEIDAFLRTQHPRRTKRLRQSIGVVVRMIMEGRGWKKTGKKGSLGVRAAIEPRTTQAGAYHNSGGLAFWFLRAERYERAEGMPFRSVRQLRRELDASAKPKRSAKPASVSSTKGRATSKGSSSKGSPSKGSLSNGSSSNGAG